MGRSAKDGAAKIWGQFVIGLWSNFKTPDIGSVVVSGASPVLVLVRLEVEGVLLVVGGTLPSERCCIETGSLLPVVLRN